MPGLDPGIQGGESGSRWPLDHRVKPGDDKEGTPDIFRNHDSHPSRLAQMARISSDSVIGSKGLEMTSMAPRAR